MDPLLVSVDLGAFCDLQPTPHHVPSVHVLLLIDIHLLQAPARAAVLGVPKEEVGRFEVSVEPRRRT